MRMNVDRYWHRNGSRNRGRSRWERRGYRSGSRSLILFPFAFAIRRKNDTVKHSFPSFLSNPGSTINSGGKRFIFQLIDSKFQFFFGMSNKANRVGSLGGSNMALIGLEDSLISIPKETLTSREGNTTRFISGKRSFLHQVIDSITDIHTMALNTTAIAGDGATRGTRTNGRSGTR